MPPIPIKLSFLTKSYDEFFFLLTKKLKHKDVHGRSSNYTLGRVLGSTLHNIVLGGIEPNGMTSRSSHPTYMNLGFVRPLAKSDKHMC
jgi:hypothetical protein